MQVEEEVLSEGKGLRDEQSIWMTSKELRGG